MTKSAPKKNGRSHPRSRNGGGSSKHTSRVDSDSAENSADEEAVEYFPGDVSEDIFWNVADSFIELANDHGDTVPPETVNAALMYAAARYSAFVAVNQHALLSDDGSDDDIEADTVAQYFSLQFRKLFDENLSQYVDVPASDESVQSGVSETDDSRSDRYEQD